MSESSPVCGRIETLRELSSVNDSWALGMRKVPVKLRTRQCHWIVNNK